MITRPPEEVRTWVPIDPRAYGFGDFYARDIYSDAAWCGLCGEKMGGVYGNTIEANIRDHRETCRASTDA